MAQPLDKRGGEISQGGEARAPPTASRAPLLSIVILTYQSEEFIGDCLSSLIPVDRRTEVLVVDGGSRDATVPIVRKILPNATLEFASGSTISQARNIGLRAASGTYVLFLDSDERLRPDALETVLDCLHAEAPAFVVTHNARINRAGEIVGVRRTEYPDAFGGLLRNPIGTLGMVSRRDLLLSLGGFSEAFPVAEDYELWLRVLETVQGRALDVALGEHRIREDSASQRDWLRTRLFGMKAAVAAAKRRRTPLRLRLLLRAYWSLGVLTDFRLAPPIGRTAGRHVGRLAELIRNNLKSAG